MIGIIWQPSHTNKRARQRYMIFHEYTITGQITALMNKRVRPNTEHYKPCGNCTINSSSTHQLAYNPLLCLIADCKECLTIQVLYFTGHMNSLAHTLPGAISLLRAHRCSYSFKRVYGVMGHNGRTAKENTPLHRENMLLYLVSQRVCCATDALMHFFQILHLIPFQS